MKDFNDDYSEKKEIFDAKFEKLKELIEKSRKMTVLTGAGVSTLSGIPDFRGQHGVYTDPWMGMPVEEIISLSFFKTHPDVFYKWAKDVWYCLDDYDANIVHKVIAKLEKKGKIEGVFTQNIDMLHQKAGSVNVWELHGSPEYHYCTECGKIYSYSEVAPVVKRGETPHCTACGGVIKPKIVFYEEALPNDVLKIANKAFCSSDLCIVLGSSLTVYPVASYPRIVLNSGGDVVYVNAQDSPAYDDSVFSLRFYDLRQFSEALDAYLGA